MHTLQTIVRCMCIVCTWAMCYAYGCVHERIIQGQDPGSLVMGYNCIFVRTSGWKVSRVRDATGCVLVCICGFVCALEPC